MQSKKPCSAAKSIFATFITLLLASIVVPAQTSRQRSSRCCTLSMGRTAAVSDRPASTRRNWATFTAPQVRAGPAFAPSETPRLAAVRHSSWIRLANRSGCTASSTVAENYPMAGLLRDADGNLYGTTVYGGENGSSCGAVKIGCGVVFKLDKNGTETVLHRFKGGTSDGQFPKRY